MPRSENGGVIGARNPTSINYAVGMFVLKNQFINNINGLWPRSGNYYLAISHTTTPFFSVYSFSTLGYGVKFSDPATLPASTGFGVVFNSTGKSIAVAHATTPFVSAYPWSGLGFGTKYTNPSTIPTGTGAAVKFNNTGNILAVAHATTPYVSAYPWDDITGFGSKYANPSTAIASDAKALDFYGENILIGHAISPFISAYSMTYSSGFGTKYGNPATLPGSTINGVRFTNQGDAVGLASDTAPRAAAYPWSGAGFGTRYSNPAVNRFDGGLSVDFSPDGLVAAFGGSDASTSKSLMIYPFSSSTGFGTLYNDTSILGAATAANGVKFSSDGKYLFAAHSGGTFLSGFPWDNTTGVGTKLANPSTLPPNIGRGIDFKVV